MNLRKYIFFNDFTCADLARRMSVSHNHLLMVVNGQRPLSKKLAEKLEKVTDGKLDLQMLLLLSKKHKD
jgi:plasmid maintenance system antidote protein VapI